jgi:sporulation integral membrane protein YlbJ
MAVLLRMKRMPRILAGASVLAMMAALLLYPAESVAAARAGLVLCGNVIIPSLFPFFVLSTLLVDLGIVVWFGRALEGAMWPLFRVNGVCASALTLGLVGGYPVGARTAISLYRKGLCSRTEAERLLAFCNNSGPAFILGVGGAGVFVSGSVGLLLYAVHMLASVLVGLVFRFYKPGGRPARRRTENYIGAPRLTAVFTAAVRDGFSAVLGICAFVVFFSVVIRLLTLSGAFSAAAKLLVPLGFTETGAENLLTGVIELTSGVWSLAGTGALVGRLSLAAFMLGWAGVSVHCQVLSFLGESGLSAKTYFAGKLLHGAFSAALMTLAVRIFPLEAPVGAYLAEQVGGIAEMDFEAALTASVTVVWGLWLLFLIVSALSLRKNSGKRRRRVVQ